MIKMQPEIEELIRLEKEQINYFRLIVPFAFISSALLIFIFALFETNEHNWVMYIIGAGAVYVFIIELKIRKRHKRRIEELRGYLK